MILVLDSMEELIHILKLFSFATIVYMIVTIVFPPVSFPRNIPTIPFYVSFLGTYTSMDQKDVYERYLKEKLDKYGAVKIYFASRWNILVTRPCYLNQVFKDEDTYAKSGNQKKIPYAVLSKYTGDNVISAHGEIWKLYRSVITQGIQFPVKSCVPENCDKLVQLIDSSMGDGNVSKVLPVGDFLQRFALANISQAMLGCDFNTLDYKTPNELHQRLKSVKSQIFKPLFMNFPILDKLPIPSRVRASRELESFRDYLTSEVKKAQQRDTVNRESAGYKLFVALQQNQITETQFADNTIIIIVAGHENPQLLFTSLLYVLGKYPGLQANLREELEEYNDDFEDSRLLNAFIFETLRYLPPLGQIINRKTSKNTILGSDIFIPKGVYVGYNNFATCRDEKSWGQDATEFKVERWGETNAEVQSNYKKWKYRGMLSSFHGGRRACLGERFALYESRLFVKTLVENYDIALAKDWTDNLTPAGPICPMMLRCEFTKRHR